MRKILAYALLVLSFSACGAANPGKPEPVERFEADYGPNCRIAAKFLRSLDGGLGADPSTGMGGLAINPIPKSWKSNLGALGLSLRCPNANDLQATKLARFDESLQLWIKDLDARFGEMTPYDRKILDKATRLFNIQAANSKGYAIYVDDTTGDEDKRERHMQFCLLHPPKALCGGGTVAQIVDGRPKGDLTKQALEIIKSIEFLDDAPPAPPSAAASVPAR